MNTSWYKKQIEENGGKVPAHLACATQLTRKGVLDMTNRVATERPARKRAWEAMMREKQS